MSHPTCGILFHPYMFQYLYGKYIYLHGNLMENG